MHFVGISYCQGVNLIDRFRLCVLRYGIRQQDIDISKEILFIELRCTGCLGPYRSTFSTIWGMDMLSNTVR